MSAPTPLARETAETALREAEEMDLSRALDHVNRALRACRYEREVEVIEATNGRRRLYWPGFGTQVVEPQPALFQR